MKTIVHVISGFETGGAETALYHLLANCDTKEFEPHVISLTNKNRIGAAIEDMGIPVHSLRASIGPRLVSSSLRLTLVMRKIRPDLVQGWMYHGNIAATLASKSDVPLLWGIRHTIYDLSNERLATRLFIKLGSRLSHRPNRIIYNSQISIAQHESIGYNREKSMLISNGIDYDKFKPDPNAKSAVRRELRLDSSTLLIGLIARYHPMKDQTTFLKAAQLLKQSYPNVQFALAGPDTDTRNGNLTSIIQSLGLTDSVHLLGDREDMPKLTAALDISCSSSAWGEGFPNVLGEAMACGIPCVATDIGESSTIVGNTGLIIPPQSPQQMAIAWNRLIEEGVDSRHQRGIAARGRIKNLFSIASTVRSYELLYSELTS